MVGIVTSPKKLWEQWKGEVYLFNSLIPDESYRKETDAIERFAHYISSGGNASGACMYLAKAIMGSNPIVYVGVDCCFDYANEWHSYPTKYDNFEGRGLGNYFTATDCLGNMRKTYPSYWNFKCWFDHIACNVPGQWISCSEGLLGAYKEGNIQQYVYSTLDKYLEQYRIIEQVKYHRFNPETKEQEFGEMKWGDLWENPQFHHNIYYYISENYQSTNHSFQI